MDPHEAGAHEDLCLLLAECDKFKCPYLRRSVVCRVWTSSGYNVRWQWCNVNVNFHHFMHVVQLEAVLITVRIDTNPATTVSQTIADTGNILSTISWIFSSNSLDLRAFLFSRATQIESKKRCQYMVSLPVILFLTFNYPINKRPLGRRRPQWAQRPLLTGFKGELRNVQTRSPAHTHLRTRRHFAVRFTQQAEELSSGPAMKTFSRSQIFLSRTHTRVQSNAPFLKRTFVHQADTRVKFRRKKSFCWEMNRSPDMVI